MCLRKRPAGARSRSVTLHPIDGPFDVIGMRIVPVPARHGDIGVLGFRFGGAAYLTDFSVLPESSKALLTDLDDLILDALAR
jgi:phosphoribosyl 1,2-cyclic phosphate phosphodiesterase